VLACVYHVYFHHLQVSETHIALPNQSQAKHSENSGTFLAEGRFSLSIAGGSPEHAELCSMIQPVLGTRTERCCGFLRQYPLVRYKKGNENEDL